MKTLLVLIVLFSYGASAQGDSVEYIKVNNRLLKIKKVNPKEIRFNFKGVVLKKLLAEPGFTYVEQRHAITRNGFLLGWQFRFDDHWMIKVYFDKKILEESDNVYLNDLNLDSVVNRKISQIVIVKPRL